MDETKFFEIGKHVPQPGQVLATYKAVAEFVDSEIKRDVIYYLYKTDKVLSCVQMMMKHLHMSKLDAVRICKEITLDLRRGLHSDEIAVIPHRFIFEMHFWTNKEFIPDDPHWIATNIVDNTRTDKFFGTEIKSKILNELSYNSESFLNETSSPPH